MFKNCFSFFIEKPKYTQEDLQESMLTDLVSDIGGLNQENGEKTMESRYMLNVNMVEVAGGLYLAGTRKRVLDFGLNNRQMVVFAIY